MSDAEELTPGTGPGPGPDPVDLRQWRVASFRLGWLEQAVETAIRPGRSYPIRELRKTYALYEERCRAADAADG